jgi:hypothetical protein
MHQRVQNPEHQSLPFHDRVRASQNHLMEVRELVRHDLINQPVPAE